METRPTFIDRDLLLPAFTKDLRAFLSLSQDVLSAIAEETLSTGGDLGFRQAAVLSRRFDIPITEAATHFRIVNFLARRVTSLAILAPNEAASQIAVAASEIDDPIQVSDGQVEAIGSILASIVNESQEQAPTNISGPRFLSADGSWVVRLERADDSVTVAVPWVNFSLLWDDSSRARHEVFLQISEAEWESFLDVVAKIVDARGDLEPLLGELQEVYSEEGQ